MGTRLVAVVAQAPGSPDLAAYGPYDSPLVALSACWRLQSKGYNTQVVDLVPDVPDVESVAKKEEKR